MILLKLLGAGLITSVGGFAAYSAVRFEKHKLMVLDGWIDLIFHIRGQIDCYLTPLDEILSSADPSILKACMCNTPHPDLHALLEASSPYLAQESRRLLSGFVREIGGSYREEQLRRCDYYINALRVIRDKLAADLPARTKLSVTVSLCIALGAAILLW
ncbi:MAG: hypothetical protein IJW16_02560 [Clostridia bacterium]|nr:hypothetical protein [Clostridia bacterium]